MLSLLVTTSLAFGVIETTGQDDAATELAGLAEQLAKVESYEFTSTTTTDGGGFGGARGGQRGGARGERGGERPDGGEGRAGGGRGGEARGGGRARGAREPQTVQGAWASDLPMRVTIGESVAYKDGDQIVYQGAEGEWTEFERPTRGQGRGGQGRGGAGRGGAGRGEGGGQGGRAGAGDRTMMRVLWAASSVSAPHESFGGFAQLASDVESKSVPAKAATDGEPSTEASPAKTIYTGTLTEAGVEAFGGRTGMGGRRGAGRGGAGAGGGAEQRPQMETTGTFTIEVVEGAISKADFVIKRSGTFREREFERTTTRTLTFSNAGNVKLEVPEDALALFEL